MQGWQFYDLPWRPCPINIKEPESENDDEEVKVERKLTGFIQLNGKYLLGMDYRGGTMDWSAIEFRNLMRYKLENAPIEKVRLVMSDKKCSSIAINELLGVILMAIGEEGLRELTLQTLPSNVELDENLLIKFADKAIDSLECLELNLKGLKPHTMQSLINMMKIIFESGTNVATLNL